MNFKTKILSFVTTAVLAGGTLMGSTSSAHAEGALPPIDFTHMNGSFGHAGTQTDPNSVSMWWNDSASWPANTSIRVTVTNCEGAFTSPVTPYPVFANNWPGPENHFAGVGGNAQTSGYGWVFGDGPAYKFPPVFTWSVTISAPGYASESQSFNQNMGSLGHDCSSSGTVNNSSKNPVKKWGVKHGSAKSGHNVSVKKPKTVAGAKVTYTWTAKNKVVGHKAKLKLKKAWKHKAIKVKVTVSKSGYATKAKTYSFGKEK